RWSRSGGAARAAGKQLLDRRVVAPTLRAHLVPRARGRILVGPEAKEARAVAKAVALELVEAHLADELRLDGVPVKLLAARPAALPARDALVAALPGRLQLGQVGLELAPHGSREPRAVADEVERAVVGVEAEQERRDPAVGLVAPAEADDHAVAGLV